MNGIHMDNNHQGEDEEELPEELELTEEEKEVLFIEAEKQKEEGNTLFKKKEFEEAKSRYAKAIELCPDDRKEAIAIYNSNVAACLMEQKSYEDAVGYCTKALENNPHFSKALKRRARANWEWGKWSALEASLKDCEEYLKPFPGDQEIQKLHSQLPARIELQKKRETEEMMGKLKDVGNQFLGMFGMTLDNFQMKQDPKTGSYSVQMNNEAKK